MSVEVHVDDSPEDTFLHEFYIHFTIQLKLPHALSQVFKYLDFIEGYKLIHR